MTSEEVSRLIYRPIYNWGGGIHPCSQITTANLNKDLFSCKCQSDSMIQGASERTEKRRRKTSGDRRSWRVGGRKNLK